MKKTIAILLVLAVMVGGVFADSGDTLILTTTRKANTLIGFCLSGSLPTTYGTSLTTLATGTSVVASEVAGAYGIGYVSNAYDKVKISLKASKFIGDTNSSNKYDYTLGVTSTVSGSSEIQINSDDTAVDLYTETAVATAPRFYAGTITSVTYDSSLWIADSYKSTLTLTLTTV